MPVIVSAAKRYGPSRSWIGNTSKILLAAVCGTGTLHCGRYGYDLGGTGDAIESTAGASATSGGTAGTGFRARGGGVGLGGASAGSASTGGAGAVGSAGSSGSGGSAGSGSGYSDTGFEVAPGRTFTCARNNGRVACWGDGSVGALGNGEFGKARAQPQVVAGLSSVVDIGAGDQHVCAVLSDGQLYCWGSNRNGQLGDGTLTDKHTPTPIDNPPAGEVFVQVAGGFQHTCAVAQSGNVYCWGSDDTALPTELGNDAGPSRTPVQVVGVDDGKAVALNTFHSCILRQGGGVACFGRNSTGQLGTGDTTDRTTATPVVGLPEVTEITTGSAFTCARALDATVWCWGSNSDGVLRLPRDTDPHPSPVQVASVDRVTQVTAGANFACAARGVEHPLLCWGQSDGGQLGNGYSAGAKLEPPGPTTTDLATGRVWTDHATVCAWGQPDSTYCWGANHYLQVSETAGTPVDVPTVVPTIP